MDFGFSPFLVLLANIVAGLMGQVDLFQGFLFLFFKDSPLNPQPSTFEERSAPEPGLSPFLFFHRCPGECLVSVSVEVVGPPPQSVCTRFFFFLLPDWLWLAILFEMDWRAFVDVPSPFKFFPLRGRFSSPCFEGSSCAFDKLNRRFFEQLFPSSFPIPCHLFFLCEFSHRQEVFRPAGCLFFFLFPPTLAVGDPPCET